ncbi:uncharacterized protein LTR77_003540 [Saxophila tyrrhenica]|uniref:Acid phosphatase n=1 Tax=Saxophila tyrrhenica TaxID=1690608 RepID=A0AAV9PE21_9PEZI|nr:hypothetical protein LTR77_003540 [Saxophila tyrrhenica]
MKYITLTSLAIAGAIAQPATTHKTSSVKGKAFDRFITVWLENTDYDKAAGDPNLSWLASQGITLSNYFGVTHPSEPNYCASHGGDNFGMDNDDFNQIDGNVSAVTALLEDKRISWGSYQEDMPYTGFQGDSYVNQETKANDYVRKHNPPVLYNRNTDGKRLSYQKNFTIFYEDLKHEKLPQWMFITPNMTNDGHDSSVTVAGSWARSFLTPLLNNDYFMERTLILLTFDENHTYQRANKVFSILLGGAVPNTARGTTDDNFYNHYSELSTVETNWNLHTLGRWDVGANVFSFVAQSTGDMVRPHHAATGLKPTIFYNSSFAGPFNDNFQKAAYPAPNLNIVSPETGRTVLPAIKKAWANSGSSSYYTDDVVIPDGQHPPKGYSVNVKGNA